MTTNTMTTSYREKDTVAVGEGARCGNRRRRCRRRRGDKEVKSKASTARIIGRRFATTIAVGPIPRHRRLVIGGGRRRSYDRSYVM